ncbi:hypothetical protein [Nocardia xishanensis]
MTVQLRLTGDPAELRAVCDLIRAALGPTVHIDATRRDRPGRERWYGEIDVPAQPSDAQRPNPRRRQ